MIYVLNLKEWTIWVYISEEKAIEYKDKNWEKIKN